MSTNRKNDLWKVELQRDKNCFVGEKSHGHCREAGALIRERIARENEKEKEKEWGRGGGHSENTHRGLHKKTVPQNHRQRKKRGCQYLQSFINGGGQNLKFQRSAPLPGSGLAVL